MTARRPYNDRNPIIDTSTPQVRLGRGISKRRRSMTLQARLSAELMKEQNGECFWCGIPIWHPRVPNAASDQKPESRCTFDHKVLASKGGPTTKENGVAACYECNNHRGDTPFEEYEKWPP